MKYTVNRASGQSAYIQIYRQLRDDIVAGRLKDGAKLPFQIAQAVVGAVVGWLLCWKCKIAELYEKRFGIMS